MVARERNDADSIAKDKNYDSNIKSQKIKVLKGQLKDRKKRKNKLSSSKFNNEDELLTTSYKSKVGLSAKAQKKLKQAKGSVLTRRTLKKDSESDVSDINEAEYYQSQVEIGAMSSREGERVSLPRILNKTPKDPKTPTDSQHKTLKKGKQSIYKSLANLKDEDLDMDFDRDEDY